MLAAAALTPAVAAGATRTYTGVVEVRHTDVLGVASTDRIVLRTAGGPLRVAEGRLRRFVGRRVKVLADRDGATLDVQRVAAADGEAPTARAAPTWPTYPPPATGPRRVAVLLASTAAEVPVRWAKEPTEEIMFGSGASVAEHVAAQSRGRTTIEGDVLGWYTVDVPADGCPDFEYADHAMQAARDEGVDFSQYHYVMTMFPRRSCGYSGMAYIAGVYSYINGRPSDLRVPAHELGHNLGLFHAEAHVCSEGGQSSATTGDCSSADYGDPFDIMGHARRSLFNGYHRARLGWIEGADVITSPGEGTYTLRSVNDAAAGAKLLMVPHTSKPWEPGEGDSDWYLTAELRTPKPPFDDFALGDPIVSGLTLRATLGVDFWAPSRLVDITPGSPGGHGDAVLRVGESFADRSSGARLTLESLEGGTARVRLAYPPSAPGDARAELVGEDGASVTWSASTDRQGAVQYEVERDGAVVARTSALSASETGLPPDQTVAYRVFAVDTVGNRTPADAGTVTTPPAPPPAEPAPPPPVAPPESPASLADVVEPRLRVFPAPGPRGRRLPRSRRLVVLAADDRGAVTVSVTLDGRRLRTATAGRVVVRLPRRVLRGRHTVVLAAVDAAGNRRALRLRISRGRLLSARRATAPAAAR